LTIWWWVSVLAMAYFFGPPCSRRMLGTEIRLADLETKWQRASHQMSRPFPNYPLSPSPLFNYFSAERILFVSPRLAFTAPNNTMSSHSLLGAMTFPSLTPSATLSSQTWTTPWRKPISVTNLRVHCQLPHRDSLIPGAGIGADRNDWGKIILQRISHLRLYC